MNAKKRILSFVLAAAVAAAAFPIAAYAEPIASGEAHSRAVERHIRGGAEMRETEAQDQDARAAESENAEAEAAAYGDPAVITVNSGSYAAEQGGRLEIPDDKLAVEGNFNYYNYAYGTVTFTGAETYKVNYYPITVFDRKYENYNMTLYLPREIKPGTYAVSVDLKSYSRYDKYIVNGGFDLTVSESAAEAPIIGALDESGNNADSLSVGYGESFDIYSDSGSVNGVYALSSVDGKVISLQPNNRVEYIFGMSAGNYNLSALINNSGDGSNSFSNSIGLTLDRPERIETDQTSPIELSPEELYGEYNAYNNEIKFKQPVTAAEINYFDTKIINKQTGETVIFDDPYIEPIEYDFAYSERPDPESGEIYYDRIGVRLSQHSLPEGEYEFYLCFGDKEAGPIDVKCISYDLDSIYYTKMSKKTNLFYDFVYDYISYDSVGGANVMYADISISDESGNVFTSGKVRPINYSDSLDSSCISEIKFAVDTPNVPEDGAYVLSTELKFANGTSRRLMSRHIYFGEYYTSANISADHEYITPETKSIGVTLDFDYTIPDPNDIYFTLIDQNGEEIGRSSRFENVSLNPTSAIYVIDLAKDMSDAELYSRYSIKVNSRKNIEFKDEYYSERTLTLSDVPIIVGGRRTGQNTYDFITENIEPGIYETFDSFYNHQVNGTLNVESGGAAVWTMNDPDQFFSDFCLQTGTYDNGDPILNEVYYNRTIYVAVPSVNESPYAAGGTRSYISSGVSSAKDVLFTLNSETIPRPEDISSVKLLSDGNVIADGENIRLENSAYYAYDMYDKYYWNTRLLVDFPSMDMSKAVGGSAVLQVMTTFGELTLDFSVVADNEFVSINQSNIYPISINEYAPCNKLDFEVSDTNFTEGEIRLYEIVDGQEMTLIASKPLSELKRTDGFLHSYTGSFTDGLEPGKEYTLKYYNKSLEDSGVDPGSAISDFINFTAVDKPMLEIYSDIIVAADMKDMYAITANINCDSDKITAYYEDGGKNVDIPVTAEYAEEGYIDELPHYVVDTRLTFDFSKVPRFEEMDVHLLVNGEEVEMLDLYDYRDKCAINYSGVVSDDQNRECMITEGYNLDKGNITLRIYDTEDYNYETTIGEKVREATVDSDMHEYYFDDYYLFPLDSLYLPEGEYHYEVYQDGEPIISIVDGSYMHGTFTIGAAEVDPDIPAAVIGSAVEGSEMKVDLLNMSSGEIKANVIVGAYDQNGALIDLSSEVPVTIAPNGELKGVSVPTAAGAARYKVFVWDSLKDMRPYSKAN